MSDLVKRAPDGLTHGPRCAECGTDRGSLTAMEGRKGMYCYSCHDKLKPVPATKWGGQCAVGLYFGERSFPQQGNHSVRGVFGKVGLEEACHAKVTARCQYMVNGILRPYYWLACDNPEHRQDAGVIEHLDDDGRVIRVERIRPLPEAPTVQPAVALLLGIAGAAVDAVVEATKQEVLSRKTKPYEKGSVFKTPKRWVFVVKAWERDGKYHARVRTALDHEVPR